SFTTATVGGNALYLADTSITLGGAIGPVSVAASNVNFIYNPSTVTDWSAAGVTGTVTAGLFSLSGAAASVTVTGLGVISVDTFQISRKTAVTVGGNTGSLFTIGLTGIALTISADAASLSVTGGSLTVASFTTATVGGNALYLA